MITEEDKKEQNSNSAKILLHQYTVLILGGFGFEKTNTLLNLINHEPVLKKFTYILKINMQQNINCYLTKKGSASLKYLNDL